MSNPDYCRRGLWVLLLVSAAIHVPGLFCPFLLDDYVYVEQAHNLRWNNALQLLQSPTLDQAASGVWWAPTGALPFYRPLGQLTFAVDYRIWGLRPLGYHLTNTLLHLSCVVLTWHLARRLFQSPAHALIAATVFALHPVHTEAVTWVSGRFDLLVCLCALASALCCVIWSGETRRSGFWGMASLAWFIVGLGCKETAIVLPPVLVGVVWLFCDDRRIRTRRCLSMMAAFGLVSVPYVAGRIALFGSCIGRLPPPYGVDVSAPLIAVRSVARNSAFYLFDLVLCIPMDPVYLPQFWHEHLILFGTVAAVSLLLLVGIVILGRSRLAIFGLMWLLAFAAPALLSMPGERNIYLASLGCAILIAAMLQRLQACGRLSSNHAPARYRRLRLAGCAVLGLWLSTCVFKQAAFSKLAGAGEKVYQDLASLLPIPPQSAFIYVVHQSPLNSVGFAQALRLRYDRADLSGCALTLSPTIRYSCVDRIASTGPDSIRIVREGGMFWTGFVEQFHRFSEPPASLAGHAQRCELELIDPPTTYVGINSLAFRFRCPLSDPALVLCYWDNSPTLDWTDILVFGKSAELKRCVPVAPAVSSRMDTVNAGSMLPIERRCHD